MIEQPQKTSRWTPTNIFTGVLILTSLLLETRVLFRDMGTISMTPLGRILPSMLFAVAIGMLGVKYLETEENKTTGMVILVCWFIVFLLLISEYLRIS